MRRFPIVFVHGLPQNNVRAWAYNETIIISLVGFCLALRLVNNTHNFPYVFQAVVCLIIAQDLT